MELQPGDANLLEVMKAASAKIAATPEDNGLTADHATAFCVLPT
jgi:hypothetical protein